MNKSDKLDEIHESLTNVRNRAAYHRDAFLVYLVDMALVHVRKSAINLEGNVDEPIQTSAFTRKAGRRKLMARRVDRASAMTRVAGPAKYTA